MNSPFRDSSGQAKFLERPIAYEFYHQLRKLMDCGTISFDGYVVHAEVNKSYQHLFENGKCPDFIVHVPGPRKNYAVIEFKLASNPKAPENDLCKLVEFKRHPKLRYRHGIEVILGARDELREVVERITKESQKLMKTGEPTEPSRFLVLISCRGMWTSMR